MGSPTKFSRQSHEFTIEVTTAFDFDRSNPLRSFYVYAYFIQLIYQGQGQIQLISRKWFIQDQKGSVDIIQGPGVVGKHPLFTPSCSTFQYQSYGPLTTLTGKMYGHFYMKDLTSSESFAIDTPEFYFQIPEEYTLDV